MNADETDRAVEMVRAVRNRGVTLLLVEHDMAAVMKISDRIVVINFGVKIAEGNAGRDPRRREGDRSLPRRRRRNDRALAMQAMLSLAGVELYYDHVYALKGVSIDVEKGETVALIGANGAGKSSILRAITGLNRIRKGSITFEGQRLDGLDPSAIVKLGIAMVPEGRRVFPYMSVRDNLMMGAFSRSDGAGVRASYDDVLRSVSAPEGQASPGRRDPSAAASSRCW